MEKKTKQAEEKTTSGISFSIWKHLIFQNFPTREQEWSFPNMLKFFQS